MSFENTPTIPRFRGTDFRDAAEFIVFAQMGPLPADFGKREGEINTDQMFISFELAHAGIENGTVEFKDSMRRLLELRP